MVKKQSNIISTTVGNMPCEISLGEILVKINDGNLNNFILGRYNKFKEGLKALKELKSHKKTMMDLWRKHNFELIENHKHKMPHYAYSHFLCCMTAQYREALR